MYIEGIFSPVERSWRGKGVGRFLSERIIQAARSIGYRRMRLDTLASMKPAIELYRSLGFQSIEPYYENPSELAVFMELRLAEQLRAVPRKISR